MKNFPQIRHSSELFIHIVTQSSKVKSRPLVIQTGGMLKKSVKKLDALWKLKNFFFIKIKPCDSYNNKFYIDLVHVL